MNSKINIVTADDSQSIILAHEMMLPEMMEGIGLEESDYEIHYARNGLQLLKLLKQLGDSVHVILSDNQMPGKTGVQIFQEELIEELSVLRSRFILITSETPSNSDELLQQGMVSIIEKNLDENKYRMLSEDIKKVFTAQKLL